MSRVAFLHACGPAARALMLYAALVTTACQEAVQARSFPGTSTGAEPHSPTACVVREAGRERLLLEDGRPVYVEPTVVQANSRGDILLAGTPNYVWTRSRAGTGEYQSEDYSIFGVVLPLKGSPRTVESPVDPRLVGGVRAVAHEDGTWGVVFAEIRPWTRYPPPDTATRLWYGVYDGRAWRSLEQLPLPAGGRLRSDFVSALVKKADTLAWAMVMDGPEGRSDVVVFERARGRWSYDIVPAHNAVYVALAHSNASGLSLAVVQPDQALPDDTNSLFLWGRDPTWRVLRKVVPGGREPVHHPILTRTSTGDVLSWWVVTQDLGGSRYEARAMIGGRRTHDPRVVTIDDNIAEALVSITPPGGMHLWVTDHILSADRREIRFIRNSASGAVVLGRIQNPFTGGFGATTLAHPDLLIAGPLLNQSSIGPVVTTLLLRARVQCRGSAL